MENQNRPDRTLASAPASKTVDDLRDSSSRTLWEADFFQITPEGMELLQKTGAETLTL